MSLRTVVSRLELIGYFLWFLTMLILILGYYYGLFYSEFIFIFPFIVFGTMVFNYFAIAYSEKQESP